jgi:hypothetical protein
VRRKRLEMAGGDLGGVPEFGSGGRMRASRTSVRGASHGGCGCPDAGSGTRQGGASGQLQITRRSQGCRCRPRVPAHPQIR